MHYALITGASKGIGKAIAVELAKKNYNVLLLARSGELLEQLAAELKEKYGVQTAYLAIDLSITGVIYQNIYGILIAFAPVKYFFICISYGEINSEISSLNAIFFF